MDGTYTIRWADRPVGQARVEQRGLYYHFSCRCTLEEPMLARVCLRCGEGETDLGICVPMDGVFGIEKRVPCKQIPKGEPEFYITANNQEKQKKREFYPVYPEEPFAHMKRLKDAYLQTKNGQLGIEFREG